MKRELVIGIAVVLWALGAVHASAAQPVAAPAAVAMEATAEASADAVCESAMESSVAAALTAADKKCEDYGFFEDRKKCEASCKRGEKCQKKQMCGGEQCPPPGYCWKCG
jgi:hypothetical protein